MNKYLKRIFVVAFLISVFPQFARATLIETKLGSYGHYPSIEFYAYKLVRVNGKKVPEENPSKMGLLYFKNDDQRAEALEIFNDNIDNWTITQCEVYGEYDIHSGKMSYTCAKNLRTGKKSKENWIMPDTYNDKLDYIVTEMKTQIIESLRKTTK